MARKTTRRKTSGKAGAAKLAAPTAEMPIVVLAGKEAALRALHTDKLREQLEDARGEVQVIRFDAAQASAADVLDECRSWSLLGGHKLVVVDDAATLVKEDNRPLFERYAERPSAETTLLLRSETWRAGKLDTLIEAAGGGVIKCDELTEAQATKWSVQRAKAAHDATLQPDAAEALLARVGPDLGRLDSELAKLAAAAGPDAVITPDLVRELVGASREERVWAIQSRLTTGDPEDAARAIEEALDLWRQPEVLISYALIDLARKLHACARLLEAGVPPFKAAQEIKVWGAARDPLLRAARRIDPGQAADLLNQAVEFDSRMKSGRGEPRLLMERLALRFASLTR